MSDLALAATVPLQPIDVLTPLSRWAELHQRDAATEGQQLQNQGLALQNAFTRQVNQAKLALFNGGLQGGGGPASGPTLGAPPGAALAGAAPQPSGSTAPAPQASDTPGVLAGLPSYQDISRLGYLDPKAASEQSSNLQNAYAQRLQQLQQTASQPTNPTEWNAMLDTELRQGWMSQQQHDQLYNRFDLQPHIVASFADANSKLASQNKMTELGLSQNPDGSVSVNPVVGQAAAQKAGDVAAAELPAKEQLQRAAPQRLGPQDQLFYPPTGGGQPQSSRASDLVDATKPMPAAQYASMMNGSENATGNPAARNPASSASGNGQFLAGPGAFTDFMKSQHPDLIAGKPQAQVDAYRNDPTLAAEATAWYGQQNANTLSKSGLPVNATTIALSHRLGVSGASSVLNAPSNTPLASIFPQEVIRENPQYAKMTAGQLVTSMRNQFGTAPVDFWTNGSPPTRASFTGAAPSNSLAPTVTQNPDGSMVVQSGITPEATATATASASSMADYRKSLLADSQQAVQTNAVLDQMANESRTWQSGPFAEVKMTANKYMDAIGNSLSAYIPGGYKPDSSVGDWESFNKNALQIAMSASKGISNRVGVQELAMIRNNLPTDYTTSQGFSEIKTELQGLNDYRIAKSAASADATGTPNKFDAEWNKTITPTAFIIHRMPQGDFKTLAQNLSRTQEGRDMLNSIVGQMKYATANHLFDYVK